MHRYESITAYHPETIFLQQLSGEKREEIRKMKTALVEVKNVLLETMKTTIEGAFYEVDGVE